jgi:hypothetical protein
MKTRITIKTLTDLGACRKAIAEARKKLPKCGLTQKVFLRRIPRADWLVWYLDKSGLADRKMLIRIACLCARRALRFVPPGEDRPRLAIEAAERVLTKDTPETRAAARAAGAAWAARAAAGAAEAAWAAGAAAWAAEAAAEHEAMCVEILREIEEGGK